jgi:hypothetical protein
MNMSCETKSSIITEREFKIPAGLRVVGASKPTTFRARGPSFSVL